MTLDDFPPELLEELTVRAKAQLRRRLRAVRLAIPAAARALRSQAICERVAALEVFQRARSVALFWPLLERGEVDLRALDTRAREHGKRVYYPFLEQRAESTFTGLREVRELSELAERGHRFLEPLPTVPEAERGDVDLMLVPALAADARGQRLGYGMGFYDATLPDFCPPAASVVVVYASELLAELPSEPHDVSCDYVVTDTVVHPRRGG
jgi:5-formyltetrahydrofolate cyclo-ligase